MKLRKDDSVRVVKCTDETADVTFLNREGTIAFANTNGMTGNTKEDPLFIVSFGNRSGEFWTEELEKIN